MPHSYIFDEEPADKIKELIKITSLSYVDRFQRNSVFFGPILDLKPQGYGFNFTKDNAGVTISLGDFHSGDLTLGQMLTINENGCESTEGQFKEGIVIYGSSVCFVHGIEFFHEDVQLSINFFQKRGENSSTTTQIGRGKKLLVHHLEGT